MDTQGFITVQRKKPRKTPAPQATWAKQTWSNAGPDPAIEWADQLKGFQPQGDITAWGDSTLPEEDDPPTALTPRNLTKLQPQCEFAVDRLHYWIPFWRDCVAIALDGREPPTTIEFYDRLYDEVARLGWELNGGYGPVVETGWGHFYHKWGNVSDAGWKGGNGWGRGKPWVDPITGEGWEAFCGNDWGVDETPVDTWPEVTGDNTWENPVEQEEYKPPAKRQHRRRPPRGKRSPPVVDTRPRQANGWR